MKLLIKSMLRHMKQHGCQTIFTFLITMLITAMLSTIFHVASSFQMLLREYALEAVGSYHYCYNTPEESASAGMLRKMAEEFREDDFFSEVELEEQEGQVSLLLTVASPGIFTTRQMEEKFDHYEAEFRAEYEKEAQYTNILSKMHNFELLVSYGDLHKSNGMYSFLIVFLLVFGVIAVSAVLTLEAVFQVSAVQRERDFALLMSTGASGKQIKYMLFGESMIYFAIALPFGYLLGLGFFELSKDALNNLLRALFAFPPIRLVISGPYSLVMVISAVLIVFLSVWKPAHKVEKLRPMTALRQNKSIYVSALESQKETTINEKKIFGIPGWLAWKNRKRFRRRYRSVFLVMTVTIVVCFAVTGFQQFTTEIADMTYDDQENISIRLSSNNLEALEEMAEHLRNASDGVLYPMREVTLRLKQEYPLSMLGEESGFLENTIQMPDVMFFSVDEATYKEICRSVGVSPDPEGALEGILITAERTWTSGGVTYQGVPFELSVGDVISVETGTGGGAQKEKLGITVMGTWSEFPPYTETETPTRLTMLVSEQVLIELERQRFSSTSMHDISLRGIVDNPGETEQLAKELISTSSVVEGSVYNFEEERRQDLASIAGFRFLMTGLVWLLVAICMGGNFVVTWTIGSTRQKEFAMLTSLGMTRKEMRCMRWLEQLFYYGIALLPGVAVGMGCYRYIYNIYSKTYRLVWCIPWKGFALSLIIILVSVLLAETVMSIVSKKRSVAELLKLDEL